MWLVYTNISFGNYRPTNALATGWISIGNLWMMSGLLFASRKVRK